MKDETKPPKEKKRLTAEQIERQKKMLIYPLVVLIFGVVMWLIFAPSAEDRLKEEQGTGYNTNIPNPDDAELIGDKQEAYEKAQLNSNQKNQDSEVRDLSHFFPEAREDEYDLLESETADQKQSTPNYGSGGGSVRPKESIQSSANAYNDINRTLGNFYETPKDDPKKEEMQTEIEELKAQLESQQTPQNGYDDQVALLEKSYELAAKYMPNSSAQPSKGEVVQDERPKLELVKNGKNIAMPIAQVSKRIVSSLYQSQSDSVFMADYSQPRNVAFNTAVGVEATVEVNTIKVCIHEDKTVTDGQSVRLRLLEPMRAGRNIIPINTLITGTGKIQGERLGITITTLEYQGMIVPVDITIYDSDGQEGIFIPNSMEISAIKEVAANMGSSLGSSINISTDAGAQLASDLGKGVIQGASQYIANKMRVVKVHLKAGYKLMLYQQKN